MKTEKFLYNYVLVNVSRTWERIRTTMKHQEMPLDNIESVDAIIEISDKIYNNSIIQGFINATENERINYWIKNTEEGMSDIFIESESAKIIQKNYLSK